MPNYYDWERTLSYDADVTMVIGARGYGKTYGLRVQFIRDYIKGGFRFVEVVRFKNELAGVSTGYFNRVGEREEFSEWIFRTDAHRAFIAKKPKGWDDGERKEKPKWECIGYFVAMTDAQRIKKQTFDKVKRVVLDEAVIERSDRYHDYLTNEFLILANIVDTVSRERADTQSLRPRVYLLGNACDFSNPYFAYAGVTADLTFGYRWFRNKTFLLHYVDSGDYGKEKLSGTVAGRMMVGTVEGMVAAGNEFAGMSADFVCKKPKHAKFTFGIKYNGVVYGVWTDMQGGHYHVTDWAPNNAQPIYYLTNDQAEVNYMAIRRNAKIMQSFANAYYLGMLRYETVDVKRNFLEVLAMFGVR